MNEPIDSRQLRAFFVLARTGSFTQAGKELYLSQSAVSHSMKALERDVGCRLFDRLGKKVSLTQAGEQLLSHAEKILREMDVARYHLKRLGKWGQGRIRIGASSTACQYILPSILREFKKEFPHYQIIIQPGDTAEAVALLEDHRVEMAMAICPRGEHPFDFQPLFQDELMFLVAPTHPWATGGRVVRAEVPKQQYILYEKKSYTFRLIEEYFGKDDVTLDTVIELGSMDAIKELVKLGLGVGILAPWIAQRELAEGSLVALPMGRRKLHRQWGLLTWKARRLSLAEETLVTQCRTVASNLQVTATDRAA